MPMSLRNLTPHDFALYDGDNAVLEVPRSGLVCRIGEVYTRRSTLDISGVTAPVGDIVQNTTSSNVPDTSGGIIPSAHLTDLAGNYVTAFPDPEPDVLLLVSRLSAMTLTDRVDVVFPADEVRDGGRIVGCRTLGRIVVLPQED
mgnify:CR=1 FL=1